MKTKCSQDHTSPSFSVAKGVMEHLSEDTIKRFGESQTMLS